LGTVRRRPVPLLLIALACARAPEPAPLDLTRADPERILSDVAWLADDAREGRGLATRGLAEAARYVADSFQQAGLEPGGNGGSYLQSFETPVSIAIESAELAVGDQALVRGSDFEAFLTSAGGSVEGELVFAGHGISDEESGWDDYAELDADGRIVLVLDDRPRRPEGPLGGALGVRFLRRAYKFANARRHGAAAVLVAPAAEAPGLPGSAGSENANPMRQASGIVTLAVSRAVAERLAASAGGASLAELQESIDARQSPASAALGVPVRASVEIQREKGRIANVVGIRRGSDPALSKQTIVVGAHLDHLGRGEYGSLAPDRRGEIHNGADDNASGVAGLLELARLLGRGPAPRRNVVIVAFTGEEAGLSGSSHHAANPAIPDSETVAMLNLDMIGRLRDGELTVFGAETSPGFEALVKAEASELALQPAFAEGAFGPSDQTSFHSQGVPVLFFFTGTHEQYPTPDDDTELVNATGPWRTGLRTLSGNRTRLRGRPGPRRTPSGSASQQSRRASRHPGG
jgi:hypothetical protein